MSPNRDALRRLVEDRCLIEGDFTLSTGVKSRFYFDCKRITLDGEGLNLIANEILDEISDLPEKPVAIGGLTMGADFVTAATVVVSYQLGKSLKYGSIVRKEAKQHGTMKKIENELPRGTKILVVDDVITSGKSTLQACAEFEAAGYNIVGILAVIDREQGGRKTLEAKYPHVKSLFKTSDFSRLANLTNAPQRAVA